MKAVIASDHAGFNVKEALKPLFNSRGISLSDMGPSSPDPVDYPDTAKLAAGAVSQKKADLGVLICGSGIGMCMAANRFKGVRAAVINDKFDAEMSRKHNDANVACFGARKLDIKKIKELLSIWLDTGFEGGRHEARVRKID